MIPYRFPPFHICGVSLSVVTARLLIKSAGAAAGASITAQVDVELWCEFPPKSESTAALTAVIDGPSGARGLHWGSPSRLPHDLARAELRF